MLFQIITTRLFRVKPIQKLNPRFWIVFSPCRRLLWNGHAAILPLVELKGYAVYMNSAAYSRYLAARQPEFTQFITDLGIK